MSQSNRIAAGGRVDSRSARRLRLRRTPTPGYAGDTRLGAAGQRGAHGHDQRQSRPPTRYQRIMGRGMPPPRSVSTHPSSSRWYRRPPSNCVLVLWRTGFRVGEGSVPNPTPHVTTGSTTTPTCWSSGPVRPAHGGVDLRPRRGVRPARRRTQRTGWVDTGCLVGCRCRRRVRRIRTHHQTDPHHRIRRITTTVSCWPSSTVPTISGIKHPHMYRGSVCTASGPGTSSSRPVHERPIVFADNDLPGVMLAGSAADYVCRYGVRPGSTAVVYTACDSAYEAAFALSGAGTTISAIVDTRDEVASVARRGS